MDYANYRVKAGNVASDDHSSTTAVVAAVTGYKLSIRQFIITSAAAQAVTLEDEDGTNLLVVNVGTTSLVSPVFTPGSFELAASKGLNILSAGADATAILVECYVL